VKFRACSTFSDRHSTLLECQNHFEMVQDPVYGNFSLGVAHLIAENYQQAEKFLLLSKNNIPEWLEKYIIYSVDIKYYNIYYITIVTQIVLTSLAPSSSKK